MKTTWTAALDRLARLVWSDKSLALPDLRARAYNLIRDVATAQDETDIDDAVKDARVLLFDIDEIGGSL